MPMKNGDANKHCAQREEEKIFWYRGLMREDKEIQAECLHCWIYSPTGKFWEEGKE